MNLQFPVANDPIFVITIMWILHFDTSTKACSAALSHNGSVMHSIFQANEDFRHAEELTLLLDGLVKEAGITYRDISAIGIVSGPGSYTGLRIGMSTAKGLCYALNIPLLSMTTFELLVIQALEEKKVKADFLYPMIDARRMEVFGQLFNSKGEKVQESEAKILDEGSFREIGDDKQIVFLGDGALKFKQVCSHPNASFLPELLPDAAAMAKELFRKYSSGENEDTAYFEPFYLKEFQAGPPSKM